MRHNRILKFQDFKKGTPVQDPKKEALVSGGEDSVKKEKFTDQVKRADLSQELDVNLPDYTKVKKMDEAADITALSNDLKTLNDQILSLERQKTELKGKLDAKTADLAAAGAAASQQAASGTSGTSTTAQTTQAPAQPTNPQTGQTTPATPRQ
jgi:hypothetical protein